MVFSSLTFLVLFLPCVLLIYYAVPRQAKNAVLFAASLLFYAWGEPIYVLLMIFSTCLDYTCGRLVEKFRGTKKQKIGLIISVVMNLGLLFFFKYTDFVIGNLNSIFSMSIPQLNLPLPIGISFYTFQTMSYTIDVYRNDAKMQKNIISFGAYVALFPQLIAGPIVRYADIAEQLNYRKHDWDKFAAGARRFVCGMAKKVLLANNIGLVWSNISQMAPEKLSASGAWLGIIAFAFQIYFDFSGYSDMAIGIGKMLGFDFLENFNYPYISASVTEFWRRWHMSLGTWFRDYVYIPLGGNKKGFPKQIRNIAIVWFLTGLWHGAAWNFVLWGVFYGVLLVIEKLFFLKVLKKIPKFIGHIYTLLAVLGGWVLFAFDDIGQGFSFFKCMFGAGAGFINDNAIYQLLSCLPLIAVCVIASLPLPKNLYEKFCDKCPSAVITTAESVAMVAAFAICAAFLIGGSYNPFLYFRF